MGNLLAAVTRCIESTVAIAPISEKMSSGRLGEKLPVEEELIKEACSMAMKHKNPEGIFAVKRIRNSSQALFCFSGFWNVQEWITHKSFGETKADSAIFPSLKFIGLDDTATVNNAFQERFKALLNRGDFQKEVDRAVKDGKKVVFTGHSSGGALAVLATIWFLEWKTNDTLCLTFGSPVIGDRVFNHALLREDWSRHFIHFVMKYDIVPRIPLSPVSSIELQFQQILNFFNPKSPLYARQAPADVLGLYNTVMRSACSVASHASCKMMGSTNLLLETISSIIDMSPYRPAGTFVFCTGNGKYVIVRNPDVVLQLLFYSARLSFPEEHEAIALRSINDHLSYKNELCESLNMQSTSCLDDYLGAIPLSANSADAVNMILNDLNLCERARLSLRAAKELEKQKSDNVKTIQSKKEAIEQGLRKLEDYRTKSAVHGLGYYDAFKISRNKEDFEANVTRLELAGIWDEIIEMLKRSELPANFEGLKEWQDLGTEYRRMVEPLDIANYYRHNKNEDTGPYMVKGRPKRYKCTQRWLEHAKRREDPMRQPCELAESCFWAEVEELVGGNYNAGAVEEVERKAKAWIGSKVLREDVLCENSTFSKLLRRISP